jgi:HD-GYP domain-containing protein (c-di-GMP phosphodiesterase class II)
MFRLLALLGGLSVTTDLGTGAPIEESLKRSLVATRLARAAGVPDQEVSDVLYASLLQHLGCTAYAHEVAQVWGDDMAAARLAFLTDFAEPADIWRTWVPGIKDATGRSRASVLATTVASGRKIDSHGPAATCDVARGACRRLGLPEPVQASLSATFASWNGKGYPEVRGDEIPRSTRLMHVASTAVLFSHHVGPAAAVREVQRRSGSYLDPDLAELFTSRAEEFLQDLADIDPYEAALDAEPDPVRLVDEGGLEEVARTFGDLVDLKSPSLHGHSTGVGDLGAAAAGYLRLGDEIGTIRIAGYLHDIGRVGISSRIWDKAAELSRTERDQARLHAYHSERILARIPTLADVAKLAGQHHERGDGSGYHRGATAAQLSLPSRVLATADAYRNLVEARPHRPALANAQAAERLRAEVRAGHLDTDAVAAVLEAAGHRGGARRARPADLTERQVTVLRLVADGLSNRDIGRLLGISTRTAEHHVQDIYLKIGAATRAGAALFAMEHGLLEKSG